MQWLITIFLSWLLMWEWVTQSDPRGVAQVTQVKYHGSCNAHCVMRCLHTFSCLTSLEMSAGIPRISTASAMCMGENEGCNFFHLFVLFWDRRNYLKSPEMQNYLCENSGKSRGGQVLGPPWGLLDISRHQQWLLRLLFLGEYCQHGVIPLTEKIPPRVERLERSNEIKQGHLRSWRSSVSLLATTRPFFALAASLVELRVGVWWMRDREGNAEGRTDEHVFRRTNHALGPLQHCSAGWVDCRHGARAGSGQTASRKAEEASSEGPKCSKAEAWKTKRQHNQQTHDFSR